MKHGFFKQRLMNELAESGEGGSVETDSSNDLANDYSSQNIMGTSDEQAFKNFGLDAKKYGLDEDSDEEEATEELQGSDKAPQAGQQEVDEKSWVERLNSAGLTHQENPFKVESLEQAKNLIQMGQDYTVKTQALAERGKNLDQAEAEINAAISEFNIGQKGLETQMKEMEQWTFTLNELRESAPDLHEEIQRAYSQTAKHFSNPVLDQKYAAQNKRIDELEKKLTSNEDKNIIGSFDREKGDFKQTEQSMQELGVKIDWDAAKKEWAATGLPVSKVIGSMYFEQMTKAQASKSKVAVVQQKTNAKPVGGAGASRPGSKVSGIDPKLTGMAYAQALLSRHSKN